ncbi:hypothetical protein X777_04264 [Ooceraea biroi]|uniref:Odorant receptor n=1 Tax=Ooceraea biroi TaxID=2015173 RepID=A0A026WII6_OOCBI|nr:hypothetical protein X777_04264 [Ooceraea biroi]
MICLEAQYFNVNRILLQGTALWPFQQSKFAQFQFNIMFIILVTATVCQITTFVTSEITLKFVFKVLPCILFFIMLVIHYSSFRINMKTLKDLMRQLHRACTKLEDKNEIAIINKYGWNAHRYTIVLIISFLSGAFIFIASQIAIAFFDISSPTNGSYKHRILYIHIATEYFIDEQKYFYLIVFHMYTALFIGTFSAIAIETLMIAYLQHTSGMFRIACYRIEHAMKINILENISLSTASSISKKIVYAINIHREAMKLSELLISSFDKTYFCLTVLSVITLSLNLFQIFQIVTSEDDAMGVSIPVLIVVILIVYMFSANFFGQDIMDQNNEIYIAAYNIQWYKCPQRIQKLILLLLQRKAKEFHLTCGGLFIASFECLATLVKATMSYFTLIYSAR